MASMWRRAMLYLGLGPDDEYDDYALDEPARPMAPERAAARHGGVAAPVRDPEPDVRVHGTVRPLQVQPVETSGIGAVATVGRQRTAVVRPIPSPSSAKPHVMSPSSFNDAQEAADKYKGNVPV